MKVLQQAIMVEQYIIMELLVKLTTIFLLTTMLQKQVVQYIIMEMEILRITIFSQAMLLKADLVEQ